MSGLYEQIKDDLGYLRLDAAAGCFAALAEEAKTEGWTHIEFLARLIDTQATADKDRRLTARMRYARFPFHRHIEDFDFAVRCVDLALIAASDQVPVENVVDL